MTRGQIDAIFCQFQCEKNGYQLRLANAADAEHYFAHNYQPLDPEVARLTGCKAAFERDEVVNFLQQSLASDDRLWLFIIDPNGNIVGETVISDIDWQLRAGHFRMALFHAKDRGKGVGRWAAEQTCDIAFAQLGLHRLELEVYSFNPKAERLYHAIGFQREGVLRDAVQSGGDYADVILMAMLEGEWRARFAKNLADLPPC